MEIWRTHRLHCIQYENKVISPTGLCSFSRAVKLWQNRVKHLKTFWNLLQWEDLNSSHIFFPLWYCSQPPPEDCRLRSKEEEEGGGWGRRRRRRSGLGGCTLAFRGGCSLGKGSVVTSWRVCWRSQASLGCGLGSGESWRKYFCFSMRELFLILRPFLGSTGGFCLHGQPQYFLSEWTRGFNKVQTRIRADPQVK